MSVRVIADASATVVEMTVHGLWSEHLGHQITDALRHCLAGPCEAIVIDVRGVGDQHGVSLSYWLAVQRTARLGPAPVHLMFCSPRATMLDYRLRHQEEAPLVFASLSQARIAIGGKVSRADRMQARMLSRPSSVGMARDLVARACHAWRRPDLQPDAALIVSELVSNAVDHAATDIVVTVFRRAGRLHVAVRDGDSRFPIMSAAPGPARSAPVAARGRGLRVVHTIADDWGAVPTHGGKVVWATVSAQPGR
ncbi:ATP-binding protein [Actinoplanes sp. TRM 88003]|uniref:ATP-binding protein n=1 Tax=Paractinoplanes aksuensis TaxID=2939490 RepID=A0ABT1DP86_9ACTN|nr:ATP-binding protein [Actinoplanes aksuensis]MCO8271556.1 ATP-binding protein [Actinoplanes aksuensis]